MLLVTQVEILENVVLHFTSSLYTWESFDSFFSVCNYTQIVGQTGFFCFGKAAKDMED